MRIFILLLFNCFITHECPDGRFGCGVNHIWEKTELVEIKTFDTIPKAITYYDYKHENEGIDYFELYSINLSTGNLVKKYKSKEVK